MNLHHADRPDWETVSPAEWNVWQRLAARTKGIAAPANLVSLIGATIVLYGLYLVSINRVIWGIAAILTGRCADILDGMTAEATGTKSPLGEAIDATIDKIIAFGAMATLAVGGFIPWPVAIVLLLLAAYGSAEGIYFKRSGKKVHPSRLGKLTTVATWSTIALYTLIHYYADSLSHEAHLWLNVLAAIDFSISVIGTLISMGGYANQAKGLKK